MNIKKTVAEKRAGHSTKKTKPKRCDAQPKSTPRVSIIDNNGGDFPHIGRSPLAYREITSHTSGEHLHALKSYLLCIGFMFAVHREVICHALKSYLPPIGNTVRKQPQRGWSVFIENSSNSGDQNAPRPLNLRGLNRPRPTALFSLCMS